MTGAVEICGKRVEADSWGGPAALSACSACAGDYEDPDRTASQGTGEHEETAEDGAGESDFLPRDEKGQE